MPTLLLLEDDALTAKVIADQLTLLGWTVQLAAEGVLALRQLVADPPDAVVLDLVLPGLDGLSVCAQIRLQAEGSETPIVAMSSRTETEADAMSAGADAFVNKPIVVAELHALLQRLLKERAHDRTTLFTSPITVEANEESGALAPGWLPDLVRRLWREHYTGALDVHGGDGLLARLFFQQGYPSAARSNDRRTDFGEVLLSLGFTSADQVQAAVADPERTDTVGEALVRKGLLERAQVERALREQTVLRVIGAGRSRSGSWRLLPTPTLGFPGFVVHPATIEWRLGDVADRLPGTGFRAARGSAPGVSPELWEQLDPARSLARVRGLLADNAPIVDLLAEGAAAERLLGLFYAYGLLKLAVETTVAPTEEDPRQDVAATIAAEHRLMADASHYAVLGLSPEATAEAVSEGVDRALGVLDQQGPPDGQSRQRLREIQQRVQEAARVLGDPRRRAVYDARLAGSLVRTSARSFPPPASPEAMAEHGLHLLGAGLAVSALPYLAGALRLAAHDDPEVLAAMARARRAACPEDPSAGLDLLRLACRIDPDCELALVVLGERLCEAPETLAEGRRLLRHALSVNPGSPQARSALK